MTQKSVLIGLDGATFAVLDPLMAQGVMPFLKSFIARGARADLRTIIPALTPPAWTSLWTGRTPGHHGIFDFFQLDAPGSKRIRLAASGDVRAPSIWAMANQQGVRTTVLNFPVMFPPPPLDGYVIAGWMPWKQLRLACHPTELFDQLKAIPGFNPRELAMDMTLEAKATEGGKEDEYVSWAEMHTEREQQWLRVIRSLMETDPTGLTAVLLDGPDKIQHLCWRFLDPTYFPTHPTPEEQRIHAQCVEYFHQLDGVLQAIVELAGPDTTVVMASDHGFGATTEVFHINSWLEQAGYLRWTSSAPGEGNASGTLGMEHLARHTQWLDWEHTTAYAATPTGNGIHIVMGDGAGKPGVQPAEYEQFRAKLIKDLQAFVDPATREPVVSEVWTRDQVFSGPAMNLAPDLTLVLRDHGLVSILPGDPVLQPRAEVAGCHRPTGVFMAAGPGIRSGLTLPELSLLDVAPTLLYSLELGIPEDLEGHVPLEIFEPALRSERPVYMAPTTPTQPIVAEADEDEGYDEEAEAVMMARLRDLGYVE